jgi:integrase/recombinase XerC/integrase/recombinase XerD
MDMNNAVAKFLDACRNEIKLAEKTTRAYAYDLGQFSDFMQNKLLADVDASDVNRYLDYLNNEQTLKDSTIRRKIMTLKAFFRYFNNAGIVGKTPLENVDRKYKMTKSLPKILNSRDMTRLLEFLTEDVARLENELRPGCGRKVKLHYENSIRDRAIIEVLFATAMRIGELSDLNMPDVDLETRAVHIKGKGHRDRTLVLGSATAIESLKEYLKIRRNQQGEANALFLNRFGGRLSIFAIENLFERIRKASGIRRRLTPHALRHTMATMLLNSGKDIRQVQGILGHSSSVTTQIYEEVAPRRQRKGGDSFSESERLSVQAADETTPRRPRTVRRRKGEKGIPLVRPTAEE